MKLYHIFIVVLVLALGACSMTDDETTVQNVMELDVPENFEYRLDRNVEVVIGLETALGQPIEGITYNVYYPNTRGELKRLSRFTTNESGTIDNGINVPHYVNSLFISGFMNTEEVPISNGVVTYFFNTGSEGSNQDGRDDNYVAPERNRNFSYLDDIQYNYWGVPYPVMMEEVTDSVLIKIDTSLPERIGLEESHPQYLADDILTNLVVEDSSDVWLTFVTEGAGHRNALGFYTYDLEEGAPEDASSLEHTIIFPNCSLSNSGGNMTPGMTLHLGKFGAGTVIGWFLVGNGWEWGSNVSETAQRWYSDKQYNPEPEEYSQHSVLLYDDQSELFLVAFEDLERPAGDNDFNDAVFFATANPIENIVTDNIPPIDIPVDSDGDGVNDPFDEFPDDPERAYYHYYPAENEQATLVFEDKWPSYGDYDLNDMVMDYQYQIVKSADNEIVDMFCNFELKAAGAYYNNGFSVQLPFASGNLELVDFTDNISPELVADGDYTILDLFRNTTSITGLSAGVYYNTEQEAPYYDSSTFSCQLSLIDPQPMDELDFGFPFNPFVRARGVNSHEIHLMNYSPTSRANQELFQTGDDASVPASGEYYLSTTNLNWGLNLPESWKYPAEKNSILETYFHFAAWAESGGTVHTDWFADDSGNYDENMIYNVPR